MQPRSQQLNLILFMVLSSVVIIGWLFVSPYFRPPDQKPDPQGTPPQAKANPRIGRLPALWGHPFSAANEGVGGFAMLGVDALYLFDAYRVPPSDPRLLAAWPKADFFAANLVAGLHNVEPGLAVTSRLASEMLVASWGTRKNPNLLVLSTTKAPPANAPPIVLGSASPQSDYFIRARLSPLGAAVRQVILNRFEKADAEGRPVRGEPLELVNEDLNKEIGSNLLYHVANPGERLERPLNTLGQTYSWEVQTAPVVGKVAGWNAEAGELKMKVEGVAYSFLLSGPASAIPPLPAVLGASDLLKKLTDLQEGQDLAVVFATRGDKLVVRDVLPPDDASPLLHTVSFAAAVQKVIVTKTFTLEPQKYHLRLTIKIEAAPGVDEKEAIKFRYQLTSGHGLPIEGEWYTSTFRNALIGLIDQNGYSTRSLTQLQTIMAAGGEFIQQDGKPGSAEWKAIKYGGIGVQYFASLVVVSPDDLKEMYIDRATPTIVTSVVKGQVKSKKASDQSGELEIVGTDKVTYTVVVPWTSLDLRDRFDILRTGDPVVATVLWNAYDKLIAQGLYVGSETHELFFGDINVHLVSTEIILKPGQAKEHHYLLYNGPLKVRLLGQLTGNQAVPDDLMPFYHDTLHLNTLTDAPWDWWGKSIFSGLGLTWLLIQTTNLMHGVLWLLHTYLFPWSWGVCIILLTLIVRGIMYPLSRKATLNTLKMQALQPELKKLKEKYKDDQQALGLAQMELYRKNKVSLTGSCWTMFLQMPIFMGLYYCLQESIHFRLAPFFPDVPWLQYWIQNLAAPDMLFLWSWMPIFGDPATRDGWFSFLYLGPYFNLLPVFAAALMFFVQKMMMPPPTTEQEEMQRSMMKFMPIMMGFIFFRMASGLITYFIISSLWGLIERKLLLPKRHPDHAPGQGGTTVVEKKDDAKPSFFAKALDSLKEMKNQSAAPASMPTAAPTENRRVEEPSKGSKKNRKQRRKERQERKKNRPAEGARPPTSPPNGSGNGQPGLVDKLRAWVKDVLKKAEKR